MIFPDETYRAYLLGLADAETEAAIEEAILDGRVDPEYLHQIEGELIDDHLFHHLSGEEERIAGSRFLTAPQRAARLEFNHALQQYAVRYDAAQQDPAQEDTARHDPARRAATWQAPAPGRIKLLVKLRGLGLTPLILPFASALACCALAVYWLAQRNLSLNQQLAQTTQQNDEQQRIIASIQQQQKRSSEPPATSTHPAGSIPSVPPVNQVKTEPVLELSPTSRGLATVPVLHLPSQAATASLVIELPFDAASKLSEELLDAGNKQIWSQQFSDAASASTHGVSTIVLPAALLSSGEYRLRAVADASADAPGATATYLFRVRKD